MTIFGSPLTTMAQACHDRSRQVAPAIDTGSRDCPIVDSLSRAWGVQHQSPGKQVWADVAVPSGLTLAVDCRL